MLTSIYAGKNNAEQALDAFQKGATLSPTGVGALAYIHAAEMYERSNKPDESAQLIQQAAKLYPKDGVVLYNLGRLQAGQGYLNLALTTLHEAIECAPTYGLMYFALATIYEKQGDRLHAHEALQDGLAVAPEDPQLLSLEKEWISK